LKRRGKRKSGGEREMANTPMEELRNAAYGAGQDAEEALKAMGEVENELAAVYQRLSLMQDEVARYIRNREAMTHAKDFELLTRIESALDEMTNGSEV
jgi:uncharacterized coiled-coil DUF342 family protein